MDDQGFLIPSDTKGGQFIKFAATPIETTPEVFTTNAAANAWCDKYEDTLEALEKTSGVQNVENTSIKLSKKLEEKD